MKMYKTIRHGENSLQYTILPQNDDFRIEGKLTSAESSCSSSGRKSKTKRPRRRSFFAYLGLIFVCTVIVGAVLIPFLVSAECLPNPTDWFLGKNIEKHDKPTSSGVKGHGTAALIGAHSNFIGSGINIGKTVKIINQAGVEKVVLRVNKTSSNITGNSKSNLNTKYQIKSENEILQANENSNEQQKFAAGNTMPVIDTQSTAQNEIQKLASNDVMEVETENLQNINQNAAQTNAQLKGDIGIAQTQGEITVSNQLNQDLNNKFADIPPNEHFVTEVRFEPVETVSSKPSGAIPTIVVTTLRNQFTNNEVTVQQSQQQQPQLFQQTQPQQEQFIVQSQTAPNVRPTTTLSNSMSTVNNGSNSTTPTSSLMTRIIQVPLLKAAAKKPIIPPVLIKTNSQLATANNFGSNGNEELGLATSSSLPEPEPGVTSDVINSNSGETVVKPAKANDWIHAHWPFIDPSTYFQWTGYKAEDSVLLPALLGFTLVAMISIITVCLVARKKQTILSSIRRRNRNDVEENGAEDNTTLLTTANLSDED